MKVINREVVVEYHLIYMKIMKVSCGKTPKEAQLLGASMSAFWRQQAFPKISRSLRNAGQGSRQLPLESICWTCRLKAARG